LIAGNNVTLTPSNGLGAVTITAAQPAAIPNQLVTFSASDNGGVSTFPLGDGSGNGSYSLGAGHVLGNALAGFAPTFPANPAQALNFFRAARPCALSNLSVSLILANQTSITGGTVFFRVLTFSPYADGVSPVPIGPFFVSSLATAAQPFNLNLTFGFSDNTHTVYLNQGDLFGIEMVISGLVGTASTAFAIGGSLLLT
jgi:hypothetical protein